MTMPDYLLLMHNDTSEIETGVDWAAYLEKLGASGNFQGGSAIGDGVCARKSGVVPAISGQLTGFLRIYADTLEEARAYVAGNPVYEAGGTVEIRKLPQTD